MTPELAAALAKRRGKVQGEQPRPRPGIDDNAEGT
jgi:hypothetical protein